MSAIDKYFYAELGRLAAAADKLPKPAPGTFKDQGGFRFVGARRHNAGRQFVHWELLGPAGNPTGVCFGHWEFP